MIIEFFDENTGQYGDAEWPEIVQAVNDGTLSPRVLVRINERWVSYTDACTPPAAKPPPLQAAVPVPVYNHPAAPLIVQLQPKTSPVTWGCLVIVIVVVVTGIISSIVSPSKPSRVVPDTEIAYIFATDAIKAALKDPASGEFPPFSDPGSDCVKRNDGRFDAHGTVRATNGFGAHTVERWRCVVEWTSNGGMREVWGQLGDVKTGPFPQDK